jgi:hypothetical protein
MEKNCHFLIADRGCVINAVMAEAQNCGMGWKASA